MSRSPVAPWPAKTPPPSSYLRLEREPNPPGPGPVPPPLPRQGGTTISDDPAVEEAKINCQLYANNNNVTCFPPAGEQVYQHQWAAVVWNSRRPQLTYTNLVNLYLVNADTQEPLFSITNVQNPTGTAGQYNVLVNDSWFGASGATWQTGENLSYPFFWVVTDNQGGLDGSQTTNPTFFAVQTTYADSVVSTMLSSSASLSSVSAQSTLSVHSSLSTASVASASVAGLANPSSSVQPQQDSSVFPHWAIAVIVVLGFLAIVAGGILVWLILRRIRRRALQSNRGSMGSASPMMADAHHQQSPNLPLLVAGGVSTAGALGRSSSEHHRPPSVVSPDGASEVSRAHSAGDSGPFSGADAAIMADAFRKALRKPDFAATPVEENDDGKDDVINRELAEEGRDIRSVGSSRGVRVETLSETGDRAQDH